MKRNGKQILLTIFLLSAFLFVIYATVQVADAMNETNTTETETEIVTTETEFDFSTEITTPIPVEGTIGMYEYDGYYYLLCTVIECNEDTFTVVLPNGEMEIFYMIPDPPVDDELNPYFERITFVVPVEEIDNLDSWEARYPW